MKKISFFYKRLIWYITGLFLFFAPFALIERFFSWLLHTESRQDIHAACLRCGLQGLTGGIKIDFLSARALLTILLLISAFFMGPIFCRFFCINGAITEALSKLVPDKLKINWQKYINPIPVKYGILTGFLITPFIGLSVACAYCNFSLVQRMITGLNGLDIGVLSSANILTLLIWFFILGIFSKGGRGFCSYLCPVGAAQSLMYSIGRKLKFTYKLNYSAIKCSSCGKCIKKCPMGALSVSKDGLKYNPHNCICCNECVNACSKNALTYGNTENDTINLDEIIINGSENEIH